jgi:hypothetical protein
MGDKVFIVHGHDGVVREVFEETGIKRFTRCD